MATKNKKPRGRKFIIDGNEYIVYKENLNTYVRLDDEIVFSSKKNEKMTVSQWLKQKK